MPPSRRATGCPVILPNRSQRAMSMPLMACSTDPPRPCQNVVCRSRSVTRIGSSARSPMKNGRSSLTAPSTSALLVKTLPTPASPSSVRTSTMVWTSSSGLSSSAQPPSTVPPASPVMRISVIFMGCSSFTFSAGGQGGGPAPLHRPQALNVNKSVNRVRPRQFLTLHRLDRVVLIDEHDLRSKFVQLRVLDVGEGRDDHEVAGLGEQCRRPVGADDAGADLAGHRVGAETGAADRTSN